jgi:1-acyl-sn-glycerol-3-phosphate acyltransferase
MSPSTTGAAQVIQLPRRSDVEPPPAAADTVDEWGRDARLVELLWPVVRLRWKITTVGAQHLPTAGGALLVTNERRLSMSPLYVAWALARASGRPVRFVGRPDSAPLGSALRRIGALLDHPDEVRGALRHGQLVVVGAGATNHPRHAGAVDHHMIGAALTTGAAVVPVASTSSIFGRGARVEVGAPIGLRHARRGPLADVEVAEATQRHLQKMLDG